MTLVPSNVDLLKGKLYGAEVLVARDVIQNPLTFMGLMKLLLSNDNTINTLHMAGFFPYT